MKFKTAILVMVTALALSAEPITTTATLTGVNGSTTAGGAYASPYYLTLGTEDLEVWCNDFVDHAVIGTPYAVHVFRGEDRDDLAGTYWSLSDLDYLAHYSQVFWLIEHGGDPVTTSEAIWSIFDPLYVGTPESVALAAMSVGQDVDGSKFIVIDGVDPTDPERPQEFIAMVHNPEPGTWILLGSAGLIIWHMQKGWRMRQ